MMECEDNLQLPQSVLHWDFQDGGFRIQDIWRRLFGGQTFFIKPFEAVIKKASK